MGNKQSSTKPKKDGDNGYVLGVLKGSLGSQLFQIANAYTYSRKYQKKLLLTKQWKGRTKEKPSYWDTYLSNTKIQECLTSDTKRFQKIYREPYFDYKEIPPFGNDVALMGHFQSENYFIDYQDEIKELFKPNDKIEELASTEISKIKNESTLPTVAIHIKRVEDKNNGSLYNLSVDYYTEGKNKMEEYLGIRPIYIYFTNDPLWVKINFPLENKDTIISDKSLKDFEEFAIIQKCDHFIIANSSFSWWSAWLSSSVPNKKVYAPLSWFGRGYDTKNTWKNIYSKSQNWEIIGKPIKTNISEIFFIGILSCEKYKSRIIEKNLSSLDLSYKYRYFIGNPTLTEAIEDEENKIVYLPCQDTLESLPIKSYKMLEWIIQKYPNTECIARLYDRVSIKKQSFEMYTREIIKNKYDYCGNLSSFRGGEIDSCSIDSVSSSKIKVNKQNHCAEPVFFLSRKAVNIILEDFWKPETKTTILETQSITNCLNLRGIKPVNITLKKNACFWK